MKQKLNLFKTRVNTALISLMLASYATPVRADGDGGLGDTMETFKPVFEKLGRPSSLFLNLGFVAVSVIAAVRGVWLFVQSLNEDNPNDAEKKKKSAITSFIAAGIAIIGTVIVNIILSVLGINVFHFGQ